jgi:transposase
MQIGNWTYDEGAKVLTHRAFPGYQVDVARMTTSAATLDIIFQTTAKTRYSRQDAGDLIEAIRVIVNPQATLCSWGRERGQ